MTDRALPARGLARRAIAASASRAAIERAHERDPLSVSALGFALDFAGRRDSVAREMETAYRIDSTTFGRRSNLIFGYAAAGRWPEAEGQRALMERERHGTSVNLEAAIAAVAFGEYDEAVPALERSLAAREPLLWVTTLACDPVFDPLKSKPSPSGPRANSPIGGRLDLEF